ncbi:MAG: sodium:calcium antiporter [Planctomycetota bacterium]|nr:MAG: sodium:calcium antiporter [Planctomycetota bacterium]
MVRIKIYYNAKFLLRIVLVTEYCILIGSIFALFLGAERLVAGSCQIAFRFNIPSAIVGLTIVAFGTSTPEICAAISAQFSDAIEGGNIAIGNVLGSNICNIGLILGVNTIIVGVPVARAFITREMPIMLGVCLVLLVFIYDDVLTLIEGLILLACFLFYTYMLIQVARKHRNEVAIEEIDVDKNTPVYQSILFIVAGSLLLAVGGYFIVSSSKAVCESLGLDKKVVGLLFVAFGTSCPELAASIVASLKKESDILVGNIVGSNILNILVVCGVTPMLKPISITNHSLITFDFVVMFVFAFLLLMFSIHKSYIGRWKGMILLILCMTYYINISFPNAFSFLKEL